MELDNLFCSVLYRINRVVTKYFASLKRYIIKKINKSVLNTITFYLEDNNNKEVDFNQETLTFTLKMIKI